MFIKKTRTLFSAFSSLSYNNSEYLYGINPIQMAFAANRRKIQVLILSDSETVRTGYRSTKIINLAHERKIPIVFNSKQKMNSIVKGQPHQNMIIKCSSLQPKQGLSAQQYPSGIYVLCDKITDPQNLGAILRSSLFYGVKNIFVSKKNQAPLNSTVSKASSGALQVIDVHTIAKQQQFLQKWAASEGLVISTSVDKQKNGEILSPLQCRTKILQSNGKYKKILLVLGSEGYGVSLHLQRHSQLSICIKRTGPQQYPYNLVDSLNVNSALSSILYQLTLQS